MTRGEESRQRMMLCTFVKVDDGAVDSVFKKHECEPLAHWGEIHIVMMPLNNLRALAEEKAVMRIEAGPSATATLDSTAMHVNALPVYAGKSLPQAYTGKGIVMGLVDIGFDLTHPTFFSYDLKNYRIKRLWDQIAPKSTGSESNTESSEGEKESNGGNKEFSGESSEGKGGDNEHSEGNSEGDGREMPVGREIVGEKELLEYAHSYDGMILTHGTHTLGTAAGSGWDPWHAPAEDGTVRSDSLYRGIAWESDICLAANATTNNGELIDSIDYYKYTSAMDALAFKYIFDYADSQHQPCVLSFSEGSPQYFDNDQQLFYEVLDSLTGPGHIMVASAGNKGLTSTYLNKPKGKASAGAFLRSSSQDALVAFRSRDDFSVRLTIYGDMQHPDTLVLNPITAFQDETKIEPDSITGATIYTDSLHASDGTYVYKLARYASAFNELDTICEMLVTSPYDFGNNKARVSLEVLGEQAAVEVFVLQEKFQSPGDNYPDLNDSELTHSILSPGSAPAVICVGSTSYRKSFLNFREVTKANDYGENGYWSTYSSVGPTVDGRIKPDVLTAGTNIISSYSSYYYEHDHFASGITATVKFFDHNERQYLWAASMGTSMATPVVAGAIALWLEACPTLTPEDIMQTLAATCRQPDNTLPYPNNYYGYGVLDIYRGLLHVLGLSAITEISSFQPIRVKVRPGAPGTLLITTTGNEQPDHLSLYDLSGHKVWDTSLSRSNAIDIGGNGATTQNVKLPPLPKAVYAVQLQGPTQDTNGSTLVRLDN